MPAAAQLAKHSNVQLMGENGIAPYTLQTDLEGQLNVTQYANITSQRDSSLNDADKTFTVPAGEQWLLHSVTVDYTPTATAGNRWLLLEITDDSSNLYHIFRLGVAVTASFQRFWTWISGITEDTTTIGKALAQPMGYPIILQAGWKLRVYDQQQIDDAADDMIVALTYQESTP